MKKAFYRRIPAYYNEETGELVGRNWLYDKLIAFNLWWDLAVLELEEIPILVQK
ncbi:hypothetical protein [Ornithobacterium rhinotracheale]|uniref:hypothetical protein n=1 Tax=Ornithobacterium rhinotracheale TaxID=28251 RepID=UPI0002F178D2|nr:hypothetical protein [Ornithobacterium rhinotracheale]